MNVSFITNYLFSFKMIFIICKLLQCLHVSLREGVKSSGTEIPDSRELTCECWELNPRF